MKKTVSLAILVGFFLVGCATTSKEAAQTTSANTPITLDEALERAAATRQKLEEAKAAYENAKAAAQASKENGTSFETELAKQAVQNKIDETKTKVNTEVQAWKEVLSK